MDLQGGFEELARFNTSDRVVEYRYVTAEEKANSKIKKELDGVIGRIGKYYDAFVDAMKEAAPEWIPNPTPKFCLLAVVTPPESGNETRAQKRTKVDDSPGGADMSDADVVDAAIGTIDDARKLEQIIHKWQLDMHKLQADFLRQLTRIRIEQGRIRSMSSGEEKELAEKNLATLVSKTQTNVDQIAELFAAVEKAANEALGAS